MRLDFIKSILALGSPVIMGLPGACEGISANTTIKTSSIGGSPQITASVNTTLITSSVGSIPKATASADQVSLDAGEFIFTVVNSHTAPVVTIHGQGADSPTAAGKDNEPHTMNLGQTDTFAVPTGWSGRVAMFEDGYDKILDRATLLEGSFIVNRDRNSALIALDVSYVDAFTVPMVCECNQVVALGCNLNLNDICPQSLTLNPKTCMNPNRQVLQGPPPSNPFEDCKGMAYTYPTDDEATKYDMPGCSRSTTCCIGTACKPHPGQILCPAGNGHTQPCAAA
ncbi:hypothetical protein F4804DRAFT_344894 [Jackrogersella minutella]|nr:hypothetical protein F4804DRAFT_344894 [Jackrogersella minutella]